MLYNLDAVIKLHLGSGELALTKQEAIQLALVSATDGGAYWTRALWLCSVNREGETLCSDPTWPANYFYPLEQLHLYKQCFEFKWTFLGFLLVLKDSPKSLPLALGLP